MPDDRAPQSPAGPDRSRATTQGEPNLVGALLMGLAGILPVLFGLGFIAPLIAQLLERAFPEVAQARWPLLAGLVIGGSWGLFANLWGRWL